MRIAFIFDGLGVGGIERVGVQYLHLLKDMGHDVDVYNLSPCHNELTSEIEGLCPIFNVSLPTALTPESYILLLKRWWWGKYVYPIVFLLVKLLLIAYSLTRWLHPKYDVAIAFAGHFNDLSFVRYKFVRASKACCWLHGSLLEYLTLAYSFGDYYRKIKNLVVLSEDGQGYALHACAYLKPDLSITKIYNPVDLTLKDVNHNYCSELSHRYGRYILMVGRLDRDKDQKTVIEARRILEVRYGLKPHIVFVGDGECREELERYVTSMGLDGQIHFMGNRNDVQNFYASAQIFVHSSPAEGLPTTLIEALNFSLPIVSTDSPPGVSEILRDNEFGLKCRVSDPGDLADKVATMLTDDRLRESYASRASKRAADFSVSSAISSISALLDNLR